MNHLPTRTLARTDLPLAAVTRQECVAGILASLGHGSSSGGGGGSGGAGAREGQVSSPGGGWMVTVNLDILRRWVVEGEFRELCREVTLFVADGMPLVWASKIQGTPLPERVAGSDLIWHLTAALGQAGRSVYLLGGAPGTAQKAGDILAQRYPGLKIAGWYCPPMGFENQPGHMERIGVMLQACGADVVYVALGSPKQEKLIAALRDRLPGAWWLGVGVSFSFVTGDVKRAPRWMQKLGMEWVHRLVQEPRRLARRYLVDDLPFAVGLFTGALGQRLRATQGLTKPPTTANNVSGKTSFGSGKATTIDT